MLKDIRDPEVQCDMQTVEHPHTGIISRKLRLNRAQLSGVILFDF